MAGESALGEAQGLPIALMEALARDIPVLGIGWGMQALNVALGGSPPVPVEGHGPGPDSGPVKQQIFLSPGGKVSYTIGGSGWVSVPCGHTHGIRSAQMAPGLLASAYARDGVVEALERPGRHWAIGVQWRAHLTANLPKGFDNLLLALVERAGTG